MKRILPVSAVAVTVVLAGACAKTPPSPPAAAPAQAAVLASGLYPQNFDNAVRPQDDFYQHVNGHWLATTEIPPDKARYGVGAEVYDRTQERLRGLAEAAARPDAAGGEHKIGALYASFMDEARLQQLGLQPLAEEFGMVAAARDRKDLAALLGILGQRLAQYGPYGSVPGTILPFAIQVHQDNKDSTRYVVDFEQSGLGLPDRDYYLKDDDAKLKQMREQYFQHVQKMLVLAGDQDAAAEARQILVLETALARLQWDEVTLRDPVKAYNKVMIADLGRLAPDFDWPAYLKAAQVDGKVDYVIVGQPSYLSGFAKLMAQTPVSAWKTYLRWHVLNDYAFALDQAAAGENFAFNGTVLLGVPQQRPRWQRALALVETQMGEGLGQLYTAKYFPPQDKVRALALVNNLLAAFSQDLDTLDWMGPQTKQAAHAKLAKIAVKIGYPDHWRDYSALNVAADDLVGNVRRGNQFEYARRLGKLGGPIDRGEWGMTPQTVDAEYNPELNDITFPAGILQAPLFDPTADDAVNYGAIGAVIGHEISHAFDDQGAQYDGDGNLKDWWTPQDHAAFAAKTKALVAQYDAYSPLPGYHVNGSLTLGENIADNSGLAVANKAYRLSLGGKEAPVLDGFSGDQRFYLGFAQSWRNKLRDNYTIEMIKTNPHSPPAFRGDGAVVNQPAFYEAFGVKEGDKMYLAPAQRVIMW